MTELQAKIYAILEQGSATAEQIRQVTGLSPPKIGTSLGALKKQGIVKQQKTGHKPIWFIVPKPKAKEVKQPEPESPSILEKLEGAKRVSSSSFFDSIRAELNERYIGKDLMQDTPPPRGATTIRRSSLFVRPSSPRPSL